MREGDFYEYDFSGDLLLSGRVSALLSAGFYEMHWGDVSQEMHKMLHGSITVKCFGGEISKHYFVWVAYIIIHSDSDF